MNLNMDMDMTSSTVETQTGSVRSSLVANSQDIPSPRASLPQQNPNTSLTRSNESTLNKVPLEIRLTIYEKLLVNPILGTTKAITGSIRHGLGAKYGLTPAILRTSRKIYEEALPVLYDQTFVIRCDYFYHDGFNTFECDCPLQRNLVHPHVLERRLEIPAQPAAMNMRELVVKNLRPHYERLVAASEKLKEFKSNIPLDRPRSEYGRRYAPAVPSWLIMIESYAKEFEREKDLEALRSFREQKRRFDRLHATWRREVMLDALRELVEDSHLNLKGFIRLAFKVEKDMDEQLSEMKTAWENLFNADRYPGERFCEY
ncbi:hypothetical protein DSL72_005251 [Monilinia vaccinii-corymbosi]|uniref:Uncharacterized protein n=1 Tax=Monilinia vaccinii-corymbosi TaxID=61207 RepID=A0A8A3PF22_9HELO|nr:hypothetical protein DSL72_005251 [Monilinia vaccinii-corymbosi]